MINSFPILKLISLAAIKLPCLQMNVEILVLKEKSSIQGQKCGHLFKLFLDTASALYEGGKMRIYAGGEFPGRWQPLTHCTYAQCISAFSRFVYFGFNLNES